MHLLTRHYDKHCVYFGMLDLFQGRFLQSLLSSLHGHPLHSLVTVLSINMYWNLLITITQDMWSFNCKLITVNNFSILKGQCNGNEAV